MKLAIYGKGGIGKSTISANLSAALAHCGQRVLQIGCDPKHDSTRLLLGGRPLVTALAYMKATPAPLQRLDRVLHQGYNGILCAEAGGPEPGVGCAGRGILSTFALLDRLGLDMDAFDVVLYDVLGDVVCGGFAVPLRQGFADRVYVVTSEEFMSIYAANNILKGVKNFDQGGHRLAGLILNSRGENEDRAPVKRFASCIGLPIKKTIPRSGIFRKAESLEKTVVEAFPSSPEARVFYDLARDLLGDRKVYPARCLNGDRLETEIFQDRPRVGLENTDQPQERKNRSTPPTAIPEKTVSPQAGAGPQVFLSKSLMSREPLHGCAFSGALATTTQIKQSLTIAHGPKSCTAIASQAILSAGFRLFAQKGILLENQVAPGVISSDMDESVVIYGGKEALMRTLDRAMETRPRAVFLLTTCPSGVIGDDPLAALKEIQARYPRIPMIPVSTDGNIKGDYMQGVINGCMEGAAALIDDTVKPESCMVNILAEKNIAHNAETNFNTIAQMLKAMGIEVNCRFVRNTSVDRLKDFLKARLNLPAYTDYLGRLMTDFIRERFGMPAAGLAFPVGFTETCAWVREVASFFGRENEAETLIAEHAGHYEKMIRTFRPGLEGKRLMIITYVHNVDWMVESALDLGMEVAKVCILNYSQDNRFITRYPDRFDVETGYDPAKRDKDLIRLKPDLVLGNYTPKNLPFPLHVDIIPICPDVGFYGGLSFARRWTGLVRAPVIEGWKNETF